MKDEIYIDGIDKTKNIDNYIQEVSGLIRVKFLNNPKIYSYNKNRVKINEEEQKISNDILKYFREEIKHFVFKTNKEELEGGKDKKFNKEEVENDENIENNKGELEANSILEKYFDMINFKNNDSVLNYYINKKDLKNINSSNSFFIYPFGLNLSQKIAVEKAFSSNINMIQGPPGTGKTQTILNIIANCLIRNKTVTVVSNNNSAIKNIEEKLEKYKMDFLVAMLGSKYNIKNFLKDRYLKSKNPFMNFYFDKNDDCSISQETLSNKIKEDCKTINEFLDYKEKLLKLESLKQEYFMEYKYFLKEYDKNKENFIIKRFLNKYDSKKIFKLLGRIFKKNKTKSKTLNYLYFLYNFGLRYIFLKDKTFDKNIFTIQKMLYLKKIREIKQEVKNIKDFLKKEEIEEKLKNLQEDSFCYFKNSIFQKYCSNLDNKYLDDSECLKLIKKLDNFTKEYPVILSTLFSLKNTCGKDFVFDYLIIDEASQCDLITSSIAMSCAKNLIIVGDNEQLPNIITNETIRNSKNVLKNFKIDESYHLHKNNLISSILSIYPDMPLTILKEHYRCHPKIINFCNKKFYKNALINMKSDKNENDILKAIKTSKGNHSRDKFNQRQIDIIKEEILPCIKEGNTIGIITPYRNQVKKLRENLSKNIEIDTIHKFQGREKDVIIFSTVSDEINDFIDNKNLINVAVSRAIKNFYIVYSNEKDLKDSNILDLVNYIKYNNFEVIDSKLYSIFDLLYRQFTDEKINFFNKNKKVSKYDSESMTYYCVKEILNEIKKDYLKILLEIPLKNIIKTNENYTEDEINFINRNSHIDLLIYNSVTKQPFLAIETDGYKYHENNKVQKNRDLLKNNILEKAGLNLLRLSTTGSNEKEKILSSLNDILNSK